LQAETSSWLTSFPLKAIGFDTISPDPVTSTDLPNHNILLEKEVLIIENLTNLDQLIDHTFDFYCIPLPIGQADGAPVRAFAKKPKVILNHDTLPSNN
jgi:kynurenine formamidase